MKFFIVSNYNKFAKNAKVIKDKFTPFAKYLQKANDKILLSLNGFVG